jgi:DNA-binding CsgD family transcriptional regulator
VARLNDTRLVEFLETVYALERCDEEWLTQSLQTLSTICGSQHSYMGFFYDASNVHDLKVWNRCRFGDAPPELGNVWELFQSIVSADFVRATFRCMLFGSARRNVSDYVEPLLAERERHGYGDFFCFNALDPSGQGCLMTFGCREYEFAPNGKEAVLLRRLATHLSSAYRCRRKLAPEQPAAGGGAARRGRLTDGAEAVLDAKGRFVHVESHAKSKPAREQIRSAAAAIESSRTASGRGRAQSLDSWHPLTAARWTLIDSFEESGQRYVVARENRADVVGFAALTDRERQIVVHAALGLSNKEIAYTLGVSDTTVRVLIARAARRLGVRGRKELLAHSNLRELGPPAKPH